MYALWLSNTAVAIIYRDTKELSMFRAGAIGQASQANA